MYVWNTGDTEVNIKQIFNKVPLNIKIYSPEVSDIKRGEAEFDINLPRGDKFLIFNKEPH